MCDYSLGGLPNRLAVEGEELVVYKFRSGSMGLASPTELPNHQATKTANPPSVWAGIKKFFADLAAEPACPSAVCVPPGARLVLRGIPTDLQALWCVGREEDVQFTQRSAEVNQYRDSIRFSNRMQILLQELREGMRVQVICLGGVEAEDERDFDLADHPAVASGSRR